MRRRRLLKRLGVVAAVPGLAGCSGGGNSPPSEKTEERSVSDRSFQYFFEDAPGFNQIGGDVPDDAEEWQIVNSALERREDVDSWREMQLNDQNYAELEMREDIEPNAGQGHDGSIDQIVEQTRQLFETRTQENPEKDQAAVYTKSLIEAVEKVTGQTTSPAADNLNNNLAEWILENHLKIDIPGYKLSTLGSSMEVDKDQCERNYSMCGYPQEKNSDVTVANPGFVHPIGFLQYEENGEENTRYVELETRSWPHVNTPSESLWRTSLEQETVKGKGGDYFPEHFVTAFDYEKARELESRGILEPEINNELLWATMELIDDAGGTGYDYSSVDVETGAEWHMPDRGLNGVVSDSFGESIEDYVTDPTKEKREYLKGTSRAIFSALDKYGFGEPIALDGTIQEPEILHTTQETRDSIIEDAAYDEVRERILN
jgi:hypothetical protein